MLLLERKKKWSAGERHLWEVLKTVKLALTTSEHERLSVSRSIESSGREESLKKSISCTGSEPTTQRMAELYEGVPPSACTTVLQLYQLPLTSRTE